MHFEELVRDGLVKSIGVSNFSIKQLQHLLSFCEIRPSVNQASVIVYIFFFDDSAEADLVGTYEREVDLLMYSIVDRSASLFPTR